MKKRGLWIGALVITAAMVASACGAGAVASRG